jgi:hypothetical protein
MEKLARTVGRGIFKGAKTAASLLLIMIPIYLAVVFLKHSPVMPFLEDVSAPAMKLFNLPSEASLPIIAGVLGDEYSVVAAMSSFDFNKLSITTISMIILAMHSIPLESAVAQRIGFSSWKVLVFRVSLAIATGVFAGWVGGLFL